MPISPKPDETQAEFMARCVPEMIGTGPDKRPQDQAVAACLQIWRDRNKKLKQEPEDGESHQDFIDRCVSELVDAEDMDESEAEAECELIWDERGMKKMAGIVRKTHAETVSGMDFVLSDESVDRMGDIIVSSGWELANFKRNPIALFGHKSDFPIGRWKNLRVEDSELRAKLELAPEGTSDRIDEIRKLIDAGILRAVSVGFKPIKHEALDQDDPFFGPKKFTSQELVEASLVSVPANPNALAVMKQLKISAETSRLVFAEHGNKNTKAVVQSVTAEHGKVTRNANMSNLGKRITEGEQRLNQLRDGLTEHLKGIDDSNVTDADMATTQDFNKKIEDQEQMLVTYRQSEKVLAATTVTESPHLPAPVVAKAGNGFTGFSKKRDPLEYLVRAGTVQYAAKAWSMSPDQARMKIYGDDEPTRAAVDWFVKGAVNPAMTTVSGWAAELVQQVNASLMETLQPQAIYPRLSAMGLSLTFGRNGKISIPTQLATPTIAGSFVGEGQPIPVRRGAYTSTVLTPKKMAVITTWTREMDEHSVPAIEGLLRNQIQEDTAVSLDSVLLDTNAATAIRPAGLRNGVAALTATTGGGFNALVGDIKQLSGTLLTATNGNIRNMVYLMNPQQQMSIALTQASAVAGVFPFAAEIDAGRLRGAAVIVSGTVPVGTVITLDAADFVTVGGEAPRFEISDQATLHEEDTAPAAIVGGSPGTAASPVRSLWQTDSLALRLILPINWTLRRTGMVAWVSGVTW